MSAKITQSVRKCFTLAYRNRGFWLVTLYNLLYLLYIIHINSRLWVQSPLGAPSFSCGSAFSLFPREGWVSLLERLIISTFNTLKIELALFNGSINCTERNRSNQRSVGISIHTHRFTQLYQFLSIHYIGNM